MRAARILAVALLVVCSVGCGSASDPGISTGETGRQETGAAAPPSGSMTLDDARAFDDFPLFYASERVLGNALTAILRRDDTARYVSFVYGECKPAALEGGCAPPVEIQVWPADLRSLDSYPVTARGSLAVERTSIRGLLAAYVGDGQLELYAAGSTVVVFSASRARGLAVAAQLRCLRDGADSRPIGTLAC